jgi:hypothetical protein
MNPQQMHSAKVVACCGIASFGIYGLYFFEDNTCMVVTLNAECYEAMLGNFVALELPAFQDI